MKPYHANQRYPDRVPTAKPTNNPAVYPVPKP